MAPHVGQAGLSAIPSGRETVVNGVTGGLIGAAAIEHRIESVPVARRPGVAANSDEGSRRGSCRGNRLIVRCGRSYWFPGNKVKGRVAASRPLHFA